MHYRRLLLSLLCAGSTVASPALAQRTQSASTTARYAGDPIYTMVDMRFGHAETDIRFDGEDTDREFDNDYIVVSLLSEFAPHTLGGLRMLYADGAPDGRDVAQGLNPSGYGLGLSFSGNYPVRGERVFLRAEGHYQYVDTSSSQESQAVTYEWWSLVARFGVSLRLGRFELSGGASYRNLDGEERARGDVDRTTDFDNDKKDSVFFELDFGTDPSGHIGLLLENGGTDHVGLFFRRFF